MFNARHNKSNRCLVEEKGETALKETLIGDSREDSYEGFVGTESAKERKNSRSARVHEAIGASSASSAEEGFGKRIDIPFAHTTSKETMASLSHPHGSDSIPLKDYSRRCCDKRFMVGTACLLFLVASLEFFVGIPLVLHRANVYDERVESYPRFFVIGDWGRDGEYNQSVVADMMARKAALFKPDFIISTGDNFYESGLTSVNDTQFDTSFRDIYYHPELIDVLWHVALGNHDHGETDEPEKRPSSCSRSAWESGGCFYSPLHQLDATLSKRDPRWHCERSFTVKAASGEVEIFFIDTTPIVTSYYDKVWADNRGGLKEQSWEDQLREFEARMSRSKASWKLVVGHHPIRSNHAKKDKLVDMIESVEPLLISQNVRAYFCGHDHNMQYIFDPDHKYHHITSGAGSAIGGHFYDDKHSPFQWGGNGFVAVEMGRDAMKVEFIGVDTLEPLFSVTIPRNA